MCERVNVSVCVCVADFLSFFFIFFFTFFSILCRTDVPRVFYVCIRSAPFPKRHDNKSLSDLDVKIRLKHVL